MHHDTSAMSQPGIDLTNILFNYDDEQELEILRNIDKIQKTNEQKKEQIEKMKQE
jgi:hypothetical protein